MTLIDRIREARAAIQAPPPPSPAPRFSLLDRLGRTTRAVPQEQVLSTPTLKSQLGRPAVQYSSDLDRILAIPRRVLDPADNTAAGKWTKILRKPDDPRAPCDCVERWGFCIKSLFAIQGQSLEEASKASGLLGLVSVGGGKSGVSILLPLVMPGCKRALLLIPPNLRDQFLKRDFPQWSRHFRVPNLAGGRGFTPGLPVLHVVAYSELSSAKATDLMRKIRPDLVIADECHNLKDRGSSRTKRFLRYFSEDEAKEKAEEKAAKAIDAEAARLAARAAKAERVRLCAMSGTLTTRSLKDYGHIAKIALHDRSPLPLHWPALEEWAGALDPCTAKTIRAPIGALAVLCKPGEDAREGFRRRLIETPGVVASQDGSIGTSLVLTKRKDPAIPQAVESALRNVRGLWQRPDGEELSDALTKSACCRQVAAGFYYRWIWPRGESIEVQKTWLAARKAWHKELREKLKQSREHQDSPLLLARAAIRWHDGFTEVVKGGHHHGSECYRTEEHQDGPEERLVCALAEGIRVSHPPHTKHRLTWASDTFLEWRRVRETAEPATEAVWLDDYLLHDVIAWAKANVGVIWYTHAAFGERLAALSKLPLFGPGPEASRLIIEERGDRTVIASIKAHGTGKNLQCWSRCLLVDPPAGGGVWEQAIGRLHRTGQKADEVEVATYQHTPEFRESFETAMKDARYVQESTGTRQKLLLASRSWA